MLASLPAAALFDQETLDVSQIQNPRFSVFKFTTVNEVFFFNLFYPIPSVFNKLF